MAFSIYVGTPKQRINAQGGVERWKEGLPANRAQLRAELNALAIPGIRDYAIYGRPGEVAGVYPWSDNAPASEYRHIDEAGYEITLSTENEQRIRDALAAHVPAPDVDVDAELAVAIEGASTLEQLKAALLGKTRKGRVESKPLS